MISVRDSYENHYVKGIGFCCLKNARHIVDGGIKYGFQWSTAHERLCPTLLGSHMSEDGRH